MKVARLRRARAACLGLALVAAPAVGFAETATEHSAPIECGTVSFVALDSGGSLGTVADGEEEVVMIARFDLACAGPASVSTTLELGSPSTFGAEVRLTTRFLCLSGSVDPVGAGPGCVVGTYATLQPAAVTIPLPHEVNLQPIDVSPYTLTATGFLPRGSYYVVVTMLVIGGDVTVENRFMQVLSAGLPAPFAVRPQSGLGVARPSAATGASRRPGPIAPREE